MANTTKRLLTLREASRSLGVGTRAIYRAAREGALPVYDVDHWPRVKADDLRAWFESRRPVRSPGAPEGEP
jgi:excisionase family DNA binding protein